MEPDIATPNKDGQDSESGLSLRWSARLSLTTRILVVNVLAIALLAGGLFYLNNYRDRLTEERLTQARLQLTIVADALSAGDVQNRDALVQQFASHLRARLRLYAPDGTKVIDSFDLAKPTYQFIDPDAEPMRKDAARMLDKTIESVVFTTQIPNFSEPANDVAGAWSELEAAKRKSTAVSSVSYAPDRTPVIAAGKPLPDGTGSILLTANARDITRIVRAERSSVLLVILVAATISILLSLFLARTIVRPIRKLARAAVRVRMGRSDEIAIPRMPGRRDEIGQLSRALSDMSAALRHRIDATEAFAADVSHEIKNPLASLRSALEGLERVDDPDLQKQLLDVANDDIRRIDRLINDISDASRVDAELARARFEPIDIGNMLEQLLAAREQRTSNLGVNIAFARPAKDVARVTGVASSACSAICWTTPSLSRQKAAWWKFWRHRTVTRSSSMSRTRGRASIRTRGKRFSIAFTPTGPMAKPSENTAGWASRLQKPLSKAIRARSIFWTGRAENRAPVSRFVCQRPQDDKHDRQGRSADNPRNGRGDFRSRCHDLRKIRIGKVRSGAAADRPRRDIDQRRLCRHQANRWKFVAEPACQSRRQTRSAVAW